MSTEEKKQDDRLPVEVRAQMLQKETSIYFNLAKFEHAQRIAALFASSTMVPQHFQGNVANCLIALNYADRLQADPFMVLQNMYVVHGRPGVEAKLVIALINQSGKYSEPLKYKFDGTGDEYGCTAWTREEKSGEVVDGPKVSWKMVKAEKWDEKAGTKWATIPDLMFRYRAASWFANVHCPELKLGMQTVEEINDFVELRQTGKNKYAPVESPPAAPDMRVFEDVFEAELSDPLWPAFMESISKLYPNKHKEQIKDDLMAQSDDIKSKFFPEWKKRSPTMDKAMATKPETSAPAPAADIKAPAETKTETTAPPADDFRSKWINLKEAGFSTFVFKNIDKFRALPGDALMEALAKWVKIYPTFSCPFVPKKPAEPEQQATGEAQGEAQTTQGAVTAAQGMENELDRLKAEIAMHERAHRDAVRQALADTGIAHPTTIGGCRVVLEAIEARLKG